MCMVGGSRQVWKKSFLLTLPPALVWLTLPRYGSPPNTRQVWLTTGVLLTRISVSWLLLGHPRGLPVRQLHNRMQASEPPLFLC